MPIVESFTSQSNQPDGDVMCILPPSILRDPQVRLAMELRATYAYWGAIAIAPGTRGIKLALRATAARIGMPGIPDWWNSVPSIRLVELLRWLHEEDLRETYPPHAELRTLIEQAARALAAQEAAL
jgi:hypothetical protein